MIKFYEPNILFFCVIHNASYLMSMKITINIQKIKGHYILKIFKNISIRHENNNNNISGMES